MRRRLESGELDPANGTPAESLEAASAWLDDMEGTFAARGEPAPEQPTWAVVALTLQAAITYE